jgi:hypothetical protein
MWLLLIGVFSLPVYGQDEPAEVVLALDKGSLEINANRINETQQATLEAILQDFDVALREKEMGLVASRWSNQGELLYRLRYNDQELYAIASTFKTFAAYYYFMNTPQDEWEYAYADNAYSMVVYSNNTKTGNVLADAATFIQSDRNRVEKFNDWMNDTFGFSAISGIYSWGFGAMSTPFETDERYAPGSRNPNGYVDVRGARVPVINRYTTADTALATEYIANIPFMPDATPQMVAAAEAVRYLMSVNDPLYPTTFDKISHNLGTWRKYGYLGVEEIGTAALTETIVIPLLDGGQLVIAMLSTGERGTSYPTELSRVYHALAVFDHDYLTAGTLSAPDFSDFPVGTAQPNRFHYGFVLPEKIQIFAAPDENAPQLDNPYRGDMAFPAALIHQGALIRFTLENAIWAKLDWNSDDEPYRGAAAYVRLADLYIVDDSAFAEIPQVLDWEEPPTKHIVVHKPTSTVTLMENDRVVFKTIALMNERLTGDGQWIIQSRRISDARYDFPFVAFVNTYGGRGQSFYSAPWEWWDETITDRFYQKRYSDGNIRIPDWVVTIPEYGEIRADVFLFRWLGGFTTPAENRFENASTPTIRVHIVRASYDEIYGFTPPRNAGNWLSIVESVETAPLIVPERYYRGQFP